MLRRDPWVERLRSPMIFVTISVLLTLVLGLSVGLWMLFSHRLILGGVLWLAVGVLDALLLFLFLMRRRLWKRREELRQRALAGDRSLLAAVQPVANVQAVPLPLVIEARQNSGFLGIMIGLIALIILTLLLGIALIILLVTAHPVQSSTHPSVPTIYISGSTLLTAGIIIVFFVGLLVGVMMYFSSIMRYHIEATEEGMVVKFEGQTRTLLWSEARFFSVSRSEKPTRPRYYELSGEHASVLWMAIRSPSPWNSAMYQPTIPFEQYQQQMRALLEVIEGKTGLPLYELPDIMKPLVSWSRRDY